MKAALIGAGGAIGARIIESFQLGDGPTLVAVENHPAKLALAGRFVLDLRVADFGEVDSLAAAMAGCGAAIHVAEANATEIKRMPAIWCRAAAQAGVRRLVYLSSASVHGWNPPPNTDESSPLHLHHLNAEINARVAAEKSFFTECRKHDLAGFALRPGVIYGPRCPMFAAITTALEERRAWLLRHGAGVCNGVYLDNVVAAVRLALRAKTGAGLPYFVTDLEEVTWRQFYHGIAVNLDLPTKGILELDTPPARPADTELQREGEPLASLTPEGWIQRAERNALAAAELAELQQCSWRLASTRAAKQLGYKPAVSFSEGLRRSCAWWQFARGGARAVA